jgi:NhaA family Na+:H+ antiporter
MINITKLFKEFADSEKAGGFILIGCTIISLIIANSGAGEVYTHFIHSTLNLSFLNVNLDYSVEHWVNDGLMAVFFLLVGLEIERELYVGELSTFQNAVLPVLAAVGGMVLPALIHLFFNAGTDTQAGFGIPMATDIAFALGILSLAGNKVPTSLKIFLTALAIIDDLGAISVIAIFYTKGFSTTYFLAALSIFIVLFVLGKLKINKLIVYIIGGVIMWYCMLKSGVHATIAGVLLAFAIPFHKRDEQNLSFGLQHKLHKPVAFFILPIFALVNTAIILPKDVAGSLASDNSMGIIAGLIAGKLVGILLVTFIAIKLGIGNLQKDMNFIHLVGIALLAGIGFTMSIFITTLAFSDPEIVTSSKMSILFASTIAAIGGLIVVRIGINRMGDKLAKQL